jgi:hypothetical protein
MTAGILFAPWYATVGIVAFAAVAGLVAWRMTAPAGVDRNAIDPTDARQRWAHVPTAHERSAS